jgi:hypothetical protein
MTISNSEFLDLLKPIVEQIKAQKPDLPYLQYIDDILRTHLDKIRNYFIQYGFIDQLKSARDQLYREQYTQAVVAEKQAPTKGRLVKAYDAFRVNNAPKETVTIANEDGTQTVVIRHPKHVYSNTRYTVRSDETGRPLRWVHVIETETGAKKQVSADGVIRILQPSIWEQMSKAGTTSKGALWSKLWNSFTEAERMALVCIVDLDDLLGSERGLYAEIRNLVESLDTEMTENRSTNILFEIFKHTQMEGDSDATTKKQKEAKELLIKQMMRYYEDLFFQRAFPNIEIWQIDYWAYFAKVLDLYPVSFRELHESPDTYTEPPLPPSTRYLLTRDELSKALVEKQEWFDKYAHKATEEKLRIVKSRYVRSHSNKVLSAIMQGYNVPANVLRDYPSIENLRDYPVPKAWLNYYRDYLIEKTRKKEDCCPYQAGDRVVYSPPEDPNLLYPLFYNGRHGKVFHVDLGQHNRTAATIEYVSIQTDQGGMILANSKHVQIETSPPPSIIAEEGQDGVVPDVYVGIFPAEAANLGYSFGSYRTPLQIIAGALYTDLAQGATYGDEMRESSYFTGLGILEINYERAKSRTKQNKAKSDKAKAKNQVEGDLYEKYRDKLIVALTTWGLLYPQAAEDFAKKVSCFFAKGEFGSGWSMDKNAPFPYNILPSHMNPAKEAVSARSGGKVGYTIQQAYLDGDALYLVTFSERSDAWGALLKLISQHGGFYKRRGKRGIYLRSKESAEAFAQQALVEIYDVGRDPDVLLQTTPAQAPKVSDDEAMAAAWAKKAASFGATALTKEISPIHLQSPTQRRRRISLALKEDAARFRQWQAMALGLSHAYTAKQVPPILQSLKSKNQLTFVMANGAEPTRWSCYGEQSRLDMKKLGIVTEYQYNDAREALIKLGESVDPSEVKSSSIGRSKEEYKLLLSNIDGFYPTPKRVANQLLDELDLSDMAKWPRDEVIRILEPSAGMGGLVDALLSAASDNDYLGLTSNRVIELTALEYYQDLCKYMQQKYSNQSTSIAINIQCDDFTEYNPDHRFHYILMNPPFENKQDIKHVLHAYELLKDGGRLAAIVSRSTASSHALKINQQFQDFLTRNDAQIIDIEEGAFMESDVRTGVSTSMIIIEKRGENGR